MNALHKVRRFLVSKKTAKRELATPASSASATALSTIGAVATVRTAAHSTRASTRAQARTRALLEDLMTWGIVPASAALGDKVLSDEKSGICFPEVRWRRSSGVDVRHWLRMRPPIEKQAGPPAALRFVTGSCLFGNGGATAHLADGSRQPLVSTPLSLPCPITALSVREPLSLYEIDTACRLGSVIGDMVKGDQRPVHIYVHIPQPEYILVMLGHQRGRGPRVLMKHWLEAVERRGTRVGECFDAILGTCGVARIEMGSPLDDVLMAYLRDAVARDRTPSVRELSELISGSHTVVSELFDHWLAARKGNKNLDYYDLAHFGYVAGVAVNLRERALTIEVDNPSEEPIFRAMSRVLRRARGKNSLTTGNVMAIYPYEQTVGLRAGASNWQAPSRDVPTDEVVSSIMNQYGMDECGTGSRVLTAHLQNH